MRGITGQTYQPQTYLFEGTHGQQYAVRSAQAVFKQAMKRANIKKKVGKNMIESRCGILCSECEYKESMGCCGCLNINKPFLISFPLIKLHQNQTFLIYLKCETPLVSFFYTQKRK